MKILFEVISKRNLENNGADAKPVYHGFSPCGEWNGKPTFHSFKIEEAHPFDTEFKTTPEKICARYDFLKSGEYNHSVVPVVITESNEIEKRITDEEFNEMFRSDVEKAITETATAESSDDDGYPF